MIGVRNCLNVPNKSNDVLYILQTQTYQTIYKYFYIKELHCTLSYNNVESQNAGYSNTYEYILFIQHLLSALYTNKHALMLYLINIYTQ